MAAVKLVTRCPACRTAFRLVADQLRLRQGLVRCGQCETVFDAREHLIEIPLPAGNTAGSAPASAPKPAAPASATADTSAPLVPSPAAPAPTPAPTPAFTPTIDPGYDVPAL
ncbi:zinc-ribbon domain-containing protein, partial [Cupriavidus taiwanensis]